MQILIVEDEKKLVSVLKRGLIEESYAVDVAYDGLEAMEKIDTNDYDLVTLDMMLPRADGREVLSHLRQKTPHTPVLILSAKDAVEDRVLGLDGGADDYLTKPFAFSEFTARIRALFRRSNKSDPTVLTMGNLSLDPSTHIAMRRGKRINLTSREYALLEFFMRHPNALLTKTQILEHVWDYNYDGLSNIVETYVKYLRKKLQTAKDDPDFIHTMRGSGYILRE